MSADVIYVSLLSDTGREGRTGARYSYAVAVPQPALAAYRRLIVQAFVDVVNTVVANVFIVNADLPAQDMQAVLQALAGPQWPDLEVAYVADLDWGAIGRHLQYPAAVA